MIIYVKNSLTLDEISIDIALTTKVAELKKIIDAKIENKGPYKLTFAAKNILLQQNSTMLDLGINEDDTTLYLVQDDYPQEENKAPSQRNADANETQAALNYSTRSEIVKETIGGGIAIFGACSNKGCESFNKEIIANRGYTTLVVDSSSNMMCKKCQALITISQTKIFATDCEYNIKFDDGTSIHGKAGSKRTQLLEKQMPGKIIIGCAKVQKYCSCYGLCVII